MDSGDVIREAVADVGIKRVATQMRLSPSLIYRWCDSQRTGDVSAAINPLDRVLELCKLTGNEHPIHWLCEQTDGFFTPNPQVYGVQGDVSIRHTQQIVQEFSELLTAITNVMSQGEEVSAEEAQSIRSEWEDLKRVAESYVVSVERCEEALGPS